MIQKRKKVQILDIIYRNYIKERNMTFNELMKWKQHPDSKKGSINRKPINLSLRLIGKQKKDWSIKEFKGAIRSTAYLKRAKKRPRKNKLNLKNWGYDLKKKKPQSLNR